MLLADGNREPFAAARDQRVAQQVAPLGHLEQALELRARREFGLPRQRLRAAEMHRTRRSHRDVEQTFRFLHEDVEQLGRTWLRRRRVAQPVGEGRADFLQRQSREPLVQDDRHFLHRVGRELRGHFHEDRPHGAAAQREHEQHPLRRDLQQIEAIEHRFVDRGRHRDTELIRQDAEHLRGARQDRLDGGALAFEFSAQVLGLGGRDGRRAHQEVDVDPIGEVGRNPAGRGVGMIEVSLFLEVAHRVADRGRREAELVALRDRAAPRRFGGLHVRLDHGLEHGPFSLGERRGHCWDSVCMVNSLTRESNLNHPSGVHLSLPSLTSTQPWAAR